LISIVRVIEVGSFWPHGEVDTGLDQGANLLVAAMSGDVGLVDDAVKAVLSSHTGDHTSRLREPRARSAEARISTSS
jgi:hypothetical protein